MIIDIKPSEYETRELILKNKATHIISKPRLLESAILKLKLVYEICNEPITVNHIKENLKHLFDESGRISG